jgi:hypothetical protein
MDNDSQNKLESIVKYSFTRALCGLKLAPLDEIILFNF